MSATPDAETPENDNTEPLLVNGVAINQLSGRALDQLAAQVLQERGYADVAAAIQARSGGLVSGVQAQPSMTPSDFVNRHLPRNKPTGDSPYDKPAAVTRLAASLASESGRQRSNPPNSSLMEMKDAAASQLLREDPLNRQEAFRDLQAWVEGSLDMYKPEFRPLLFPIFVHFYLDLVQENFLDGARLFMKRFYNYFSMTHRVTLDRLSALNLPIHVAQNELARRFREEKYICRLSKSGKDLLLGWLTDGTGGEDLGSGAGIIGGMRAKEGRDQVLRVINNCLQFHVTSSHSLTISPNVWEESTGLLSSLVPKGDGADKDVVMTNGTAAEEFNASHPGLKLGLPGPPTGLRDEVEKVLQEDQMHTLQMSNAPIPHHIASTDLRNLVVPPSNGHPVPHEGDLPPQPPNFKAIDIKREVERVRDIRRRIKLDPSTFSAMERKEFSMNGFDQRQVVARQKALPSICCYTFKDAPEGVSSSTFSIDSTLVAAGFSESYIRLWSTKGDRLRSLRSDFDLADVKDCKLREIRDRTGTVTRKLVGHSGPVYGLNFEPSGGAAVPPRFLLSCSADHTARLWSLDTMTNVVAYRGHSKPVWDVEWSPRGIYFATGSRDTTARLWSSDRVAPLRIFAGHLSDVDCVKFHPNSLYLATGSSDMTCRLWDVQTGNCVRVFLGHQGPITSIATSPDGKYLASAGEDLAISLWDLGSGKRIKKMTGHTATIYSLAFSQETSVLVSGGADWTVRCWDVKSPGGLAPKSGVEDATMFDANGFPKKPTANANDAANEKEEEDNFATRDLMETFPTKRTPILNVQFTPRNLCLVSGCYQPSVGEVSFDRRT